MNVVGYVTAAAAGIAAILSAVNLWVSGRREMNRWTREELVEALVTFFDTGFRLRGYCRDLIFLAPEEESKARELRVSIVAAHNLETDTLTRLRLLAPARVVTAAETLHEGDHRIVDSYFAESPKTAFGDALSTTRVARTQFVTAARSAFRLTDAAPINHRHDDTSWWKFRDTTARLVEGHANSPSAAAPRPSAER
jgi:hypothetical protein